jgi:addiction module HigA family antidote
MNTKTRRREPTSPGEILREEFLVPLGMTQKQVADHLGCDVKVINRLVNGRTSVTADMALRLGAAFRTTPDFWLNAQKAVDLHRAAKRGEALPAPLLKVQRKAMTDLLGLAGKVEGHWDLDELRGRVPPSRKARRRP